MKKILFLFFLNISLFGFTLADLEEIFDNYRICDKVLKNNGYFTTCYKYKYKAPIATFYHVSKDILDTKKSVKKKPLFYEDHHIPKKYRSTQKDYFKSGYTKGHSVSISYFDYSEKSLLKTYSMGNIVPMRSSLQKQLNGWAGAEKFEKYVVKTFGDAEVINLFFYSPLPKRIGENKVAVPESMAKIIYNKKAKYVHCFLFRNIYLPKSVELKEFFANCSDFFDKQ